MRKYLDFFFQLFSASDERESCQSCITYKTQLQETHTKITMLKQKLSELTAENRMLKNRIRSKSTEDSTRHKVFYSQEPEIGNFELETDLIDEQISNAPSISLASVLDDDDDDEMDESSNESSPVVVSDASDEVELSNELMETNEAPASNRPTLKCKTFFEFI